MEKEINNNGYDYVDLELPSGTLWATMNVGASNPLNCGLYFQWGDTKGYTKDQIGKDKQFNRNSYKWYDDDKNEFTKYITSSAKLDLEDDAAHVNMGGDWHMPTYEQFKELIDNTTSEFVILNADVSYMTLTSKKDRSKYLFFPAAGYASSDSVYDSGAYGDVWSSLMSKHNKGNGQSFYFNSGGVGLSTTYRHKGCSVRGVIDKNNNNSKDKKSDMKDGLDLAEILKDVPSGTKLWSPICGECEFVAIENDLRPIHCTCKRNIITTKFNSYSDINIFFANDESVLFPSKENRDWSTFKVSNEHKHFESYQKVLIKDKFCSKYFWVAALYSHYDSLTNKHYLVGSDWAKDEDIIAYEGNEDKVGKVIE